ncbi:MAG: 50S ribosomal protein L21 [Clostridia bacterium]|nr:50S ribosomal protein L21 [Clostridia bacterium]
MYAIVEVGGKQYKAAVGDTLKLEKINKEPGAEVELNVLMTVDGESVVCGKDAESLKAKATIVAHGKDRKIIVFKYKAKKNERKKKGHRQQFTTVKVSAIG